MFIKLGLFKKENQLFFAKLACVDSTSDAISVAFKPLSYNFRSSSSVWSDSDP